MALPVRVQTSPRGLCPTTSRCCGECIFLPTLPAFWVRKAHVPSSTDRREIKRRDVLPWSKCEVCSLFRKSKEHPCDRFPCDTPGTLPREFPFQTNLQIAHPRAAPFVVVNRQRSGLCLVGQEDDSLKSSLGVPGNNTADFSEPVGKSIWVPATKENCWEMISWDAL